MAKVTKPKAPKTGMRAIPEQPASEPAEPATPGEEEVKGAPEEPAGSIQDFEGHLPEEESQAKEATEVPEETLEEAEEFESDSTGQKSPTPDNFSFAPKTFLQPYMLLLLRDWSMHGYEVWERLMKLGFPGFDQNDRATVYRALRQLEREGKVRSEWDTKAYGPARRVYRLTDAGEEFLRMWANGLNQYRKTLDFFFKLYTGGMIPSPFSFNPLAKDEKDKKKKD